MSELVVFKANELAVSRYDLTEHETKLILCCVALLNPTIDNPTDEQRTIEFTYQQYAEMMGISTENPGKGRRDESLSKPEHSRQLTVVAAGDHVH